MDNVCELSIEETNKIRKKLGLKELEISKENNSIKKDINEEAKNNNLIKVKRKKRKNETDNVKLISDEFNDDINDVEAWVNKTRKIIDNKLNNEEAIIYSDDEIEETNKKKKNNKKKNNEKEIKNENLINIKVQHSNKDITEDVVLTLKDKNVLDEEDDYLINTDLEKEKNKKLMKIKDNSFWNKNYYNPLSHYENYENDENDENNSFKMISKYNDEEKKCFEVSIKYDEEEEKEKNKIKRNNVDINNINKKDINIDKKEKDIEDNLKNKNIFQFRKKKINNIKRRKKDDFWNFDEKENKEDKKNNEDEENINANDIMKDVMNILKEEQMDLNLEEYNIFSNNENEEKDEELYELLQVGNKLNKNKIKEHKQELIKYVVINENKNNEQNNEKNNIKLTDTSEFCKKISFSSNFYQKKKDMNNESFLDKNDILNKNIDENILKNTDQFYEDEHVQKDENIDSDEGVSKMFNEIQLDQGIYTALNYLKTKGELNIEEKIYRNPENRPLHMSTDNDLIKLDYKNESGKVMTPKETFRHISWIFHGKKQGKNKLEKKIKRLEIERRFKENPLESSTLSVLKKYQNTHKKSYFTLSHNN